MGQELQDLGFDMNLAPVADVNSNPRNPVIGVRSYGEDPGFVAACCESAYRGLSAGGMVATAKHFPGHGDTAVDSHFGLPRLDHSLARLEAVELLPFKGLIKQGIPAIMSAHVLMPGLVAELGGSNQEADLPATLNPRILNNLLRERLNFKGLLVSDCLTMKAIADNYPDAPVQALQAGVDLLIISHDPQLQSESFDRIRSAVDHGRLPMARLEEASNRVRLLQAQAVKTRVAMSAGKSMAEHQDLSRTFSLGSLHSPNNRPPRIKSGVKTVYVDIQPIVLNGADDSLAPRTLSAGLAALNIPGLQVHSCPINPDKSDRKQLVEACRGAEMIIVGLYDAWRYSGQQDLVLDLRSLARLGIVASRSPWDANLARGEEEVLLAWEYTPLSVETLGYFLSNSNPALGGCPVTL